jgi:hypothetical protein
VVSGQCFVPVLLDTDHWPLTTFLQFLNRYRVIGIDAHLAGNLHGFFSDLAGGELRVARQRFGCGLGVGTSAADGGYSAVGLDHVALSAEQERLFFVADQQQSFQMAQEFIGAPIFGQLDGAASEIAVVLLEFRFETAEQGEGVGSGAGEPGEDLVVIEPADLLRRVLDDGLTERDLSVAGKYYAAVAANG